MTRNKCKRPGMTAVLLLCFLSFTAIIIALLWIFQVVLLNSFYRRITSDRMRSTAAAIVRNIDNKNVEDLALRMAQQGEVSIKTLYFSGRTSFSAYAPNDIGVLRSLSDMELYRLYLAAAGNDGSLMETYDRRAFQDTVYDPHLFLGDVPESDRGMGNSMVYVQCVEKDNVRAVIYVGAGMHPVDATVDTLKIQLVWVTLIMVVLSLVLAVVMSRQISRPIVGLSESAKRLAHGDYGTSFENEGCREIVELGATLDTAAQELGKVDRLKSELIANISHDMRTPLTLIEGYAEIMRDIPGENNAENVQNIIDETRRLSALVSDILDLSKMQSGTMELNLSVFCLTDAIGAMLDRYESFVRQDGYHIVFEPAQKVFVQADELKISQVIYNLVGNAVNYTGEDKTVTVRHFTDGDNVTVEVSDSGEGIPADKIANVWDRYYKNSENHRRSSNGSGLGLSIVKSVLDMHGATYSVRSSQNGTTFSFTLKVCKE